MGIEMGLVKKKKKVLPRCFVLLVVLIFIKLLLSAIVMWQWTKTDNSYVKYYEKGKCFVLFFVLGKILFP